MSTVDLDRWREAATEIPAASVNPTGIPIGTYLLEAEGVAAFVKSYWAAELTRPGLVGVRRRLPEGIGEEILSLVRAARVVHTRILFPTEVTGDRRTQVERAKVVVSELSEACEFVLDDEVHEPADDALVEAKSRIAVDSTLATIIQALVDFAGIADAIRERLPDLEDFDLALIEEARTLAATLGEGGPAQVGAVASPDVDLRNRLLTLLGARVGQVRRAARYVFRGHPDVMRKATSAYERMRRVERKRRRQEKKEEGKEGRAEEDSIRPGASETHRSQPWRTVASVAF
jgi:hypothetical protein